MLRRDYHRFTLAQALEDAENAISEVRMNRLHPEAAEDAEFIVGHGIIRQKLIELLQSYGCDPQPKLGNDGVIVCVIQ